jgi:hypothetical protein
MPGRVPAVHTTIKFPFNGQTARNAAQPFRHTLSVQNAVIIWGGRLSKVKNKTKNPLFRCQ